MNKKKEIRRGIITCLFWLYLLLLFRITVFRTGFGVQNLFQKGSINLTLFRDYLPLLKEGHWFRFLYLFMGNILWFIPFGIYTIWTGRIKRGWKAVCLFFFLSLFIETMQYCFGTGISEADDLILNTFGTWIGAYSAIFLQNAHTKEKEKRTLDGIAMEKAGRKFRKESGK